ncbi:hypothetical protein Tco_0903865 [Tanacetum coccineum]
MHRFADRFTDRRVKINNLMVLQDHPLIDYGKYALGCMTGADMKKCVHLKSVRDELLRRLALYLRVKTYANKRPIASSLLISCWDHCMMHEVWTLCRILKRNVSNRKIVPDWKELSIKRNHVVDTGSKTCNEDSDHEMQSYISFQDPVKNLFNHTNGMDPLTAISRFTDQAPSTNLEMNDLIENGDWDDLRSVVEFAASDRPVFFM